MALRQKNTHLRSAVLGLTGALLTLAGCHAEKQRQPPKSEAAANPEALAAWEKVARVLQHPRCLNCHQPEIPLQGDEAQLHIPRVVRGDGNMGVAAMRCSNCHSPSGNNPSSGVPGAPHWSLAPLSMSWAGLSSAELCRALIDPQRNGNRNAEALVKHMDADKLVLWGWDPGAGREPVPIPHDQFMQYLREWVGAGTPCPDAGTKGDETSAGKERSDT